MPVTDSFGGAESSVDAQRKALLAAVAQQGKAGRAAFEEQTKAAEAARKEAVKAAQSRSGAINAPKGLAAKLGAGSTAVTDRYTRDAASARTAYDQEQHRLTQANDSYMGQVSAAIPLSRQVANARKAEAEAARQAELADANRRRQWEQEDRQASLSDAARGREWDLADRAYEEEQRAAEAAEAAGTGRTIASPTAPDRAGARAGLSGKDVKSITTHEDWGRLVSGFADGVSQGMTQSEILAEFSQWEAGRGHAYPKFEKLLVEMFFGNEPTAQGSRATVPGSRRMPIR